VKISRSGGLQIVKISIRRQLNLAFAFMTSSTSMIAEN